MLTDNKADKQLVRGVSLKGATALNMIDMIGVGPFITIPLIVAAMGGPQAMIGWIIGAIICLSDGLVWAELGAAMPHAGGSYNYLKEIYGKDTFGKLVSFLFIFQLTFSAPLSMASGCVGLAMYASYIFPGLNSTYFNYDLNLPLPLFGSLEAAITLNNGTFVAIGVVLLAVFMLYRKVAFISKFSQFLWGGVIITVVWIIVSGITNFDPKLAFDFPPNAFHIDSAFFLGLGSAMLIALYDYWGYYNVNFFGGEVQNPTRNIPRAIIYSILAVAGLYIVMNIAILGVLPWQEVSETAGSDARKYIVSVFMQKIYGTWAGNLVTLLVVWTAFASVFSLLMGYSRVPYAAAVDGDYFKVFSKVHPKHKFPHVSLLILGGVAICFCFLKLKDIIAALVVIRLMVQFLAQTIGVIYFRIKNPQHPRPFRMWLYPLPAILAFIGFVYVLFSRQNFQKEIKYVVVLLVAGTVIYMWRAWKRKEWPYLFRCLGFTKERKRCNKVAKYGLCRKHLWQPIIILFFVIIYVWGDLKTFVSDVILPKETDINLNANYEFDRRDSSFNVLILPLNRLENCVYKDMYIEKTIEKRLIDLNEKHSLNLQVKLDSTDCISTFEEANKIGIKYNATLVIWGDFYERCNPETSKACIKYKVLENINTPIYSGSSSLMKVEGMEQISEGYLMEDIDYMIFWIVGVKFYNIQKYDLALHYFKQIKLIKEQRYVPLYYVTAFCNMWVGNSRKGIEIFTDFINMVPKLSRAYQNRGLCYMALNLLDSAILDLENAVYLSPNYGQAYSNLGICYERKGNPNKALEYYTIAATTEPTRFEHYLRKGQMLHLLNRYDEAISEFNKAININPLNAEAYKGIADVYLDTKQFDLAIKYIDKAAELFPIYRVLSETYRKAKLHDEITKGRIKK